MCNPTGAMIVIVTMVLRSDGGVFVSVLFNLAWENTKLSWSIAPIPGSWRAGRNNNINSRPALSVKFLNRGDISSIFSSPYYSCDVPSQLPERGVWPVCPVRACSFAHIIRLTVQVIRIGYTPDTTGHETVKNMVFKKYTPHINGRNMS